MTNTFQRTAFTVLAALSLLTACGETSLPVATGKADIRGINAIAGFSDVSFLIEERQIGAVSFKGASGASYDDLSYTFNFELPLPDDAPARIASRTLDVVRDNDYSFVLTGNTDAQEATLWQRPSRDWSGTETVFDLMVGHANTSLGNVDVYIAAGGTAPVAGNAIGSTDFRGQIDPREFETGEYQVTLTPAGDPATILYRSAPTTLPASQSYLLTIFDGDPGINGPVSVRILTGNVATELPDERFPATRQFFNASIDTGAVDVALDADYANLAVSNLAYGSLSEDVEVPTSANYQYAPTGTTNAIVDEDQTVTLGSTGLQILAGDEGEVVALQAAGFRRGFSTVGRVRVTNTVTSFSNLDIYILETGTDIAERFPTLFNFPYGFNQVLDRAPGDYEVTIAEPGSDTRVAGPEPLTLAPFDVFEVILLDTADPNVVQIEIFSTVTP